MKIVTRNTKTQNYLISYLGKEVKYFLCRGEEIEKGIALVRNQEKKIYQIIDTASGLFILNGKNKEELLVRYEELKPVLYPRIEKSRNTETYRLRCEALKVEEHNWRLSGYFIKGVGYE